VLWWSGVLGFVGNWLSEFGGANPPARANPNQARTARSCRFDQDWY
jgi:hypothetical protein